MRIATLLDQIPYVVWHQIDVLDEGPKTVRMALRDRPEVHNYVGTLHAGALYTLAETVAGVAVNSLAAAENAIILLRDASIKYTRRAEGDVVADAVIEPIALAQARVEFRSTARTDMTTDVTVRDSGGETVFEGRFSYALRPRTS